MAELPGIEHAEGYSLFPTLGWKIDLERTLYESIKARVLRVGPFRHPSPMPGTT